MEFIELKTTVRKTGGKGAARVLRRAGQIPAIIYGPDNAPTKVAVGMKDLEDALKKAGSGQLMLNLTVQNGDTTTRLALLKELQRHPITRSFIHADFYEVSMNRKIRARVPVVTKGKSIGVEMGGMLQVIRRELEVLCYPNDIPDAIELDITDLDMGDAIHVLDIPVGENIEIPAHVNFTVVTVVSGKIEEVEPEEEEGEELEEGGEAEETAEES